jgi:hypothetical protein
VATRYDKLAANYLAFVNLASIRVWLRANESAPWMGPHADVMCNEEVGDAKLIAQVRQQVHNRRLYGYVEC